MLVVAEVLRERSVLRTQDGRDEDGQHAPCLQRELCRARHNEANEEAYCYRDGCQSKLRWLHMIAAFSHRMATSK